jgi:alpha-amylase
MNVVLRAEGRSLPYVFLEISAGSGEALRPRDYFGVGFASGGSSDITEFGYRGLADKFRGTGGQSLHQLNPEGPPGARFTPTAWNLLPHDKAVVFLQNHDTQRECGMGYLDGDAFRLANVFMLAHPYGYPSVLSGFAFNCPSQRSEGPPRDAAGWTTRVVCASGWETAKTGDWVCEHRDPHILWMVGFRRRTAGAPLTHWWDNGGNAIAFSRGALGFVVINRESASVTATIQTGLPAGTYCDLLTGGRAASGCAGTPLVVGADGRVTMTIASNRSIAVDVAQKL